MEISEVHQIYAGTKITIEGGRYIKGKYKTMVVTVTTCDRQRITELVSKRVGRT